MSYRLISWGANSHGQLGQGVRSEECLLPREVGLAECSLEPREIKKIVGGAGHTLILSNDGRVYSCGWNDKGQAGSPKRQDALSFRQINGNLRDKVIVDVACGWDSSAALTIDGTLFLWGSNNYGQLGKQPSTLRWTSDPFELVLGPTIQRVSMGLRHTALVTADRKVLVSGSGNKGQLGLSPSKNDRRFDDAYAFTSVSALSDLQDVVCGQHHTIASSSRSDVYVVGDNKHGQLGLDPEVSRSASFPMKLPNVEFDSTIKVHSGWSHAIVLNDGIPFSWGRNTYGQLGCPEIQRVTPWRPERVRGLEKIRQISIGSEHNVALTEDGRIFCWGWNEHGNCGNGERRDVLFPEPLALAYDYEATLVGSGAGHSLAVIKKLSNNCIFS